MFEKHSGKNRWKTLFWGLMAINAVLLLAGMLLFFLPPSHSNEFLKDIMLNKGSQSSQSPPPGKI